MKIIVKRKRLFWYWKIVSRNGQVVGTSETYFSKGNAVRAGRQVAEVIGWEVEVK